MLADGRIGGVILMQRNVSTRARLLGITHALHSATLNGVASKLPPFVSVDQEGGAVQRLRRRQGFSRIPSAYLMARRYKPHEAK
ncbi:MAG: glycoside hydrolase family 3 N-terminal domain-containing protein, partial [Pseudomonadota bacterium]